MGYVHDDQARNSEKRWPTKRMHERFLFVSVSDEAMEKLSSKYVPENMEKMSKWAINTFCAWRDAHSKKFATGKCPLDIFAGTLNKWLM